MTDLVADYLASVPAGREPMMTALRRTILENVPKEIVEVFDFGMLTYVIPLEIAPKTYNGKPLMHTALANQKNYVSLYLMGIYGNPALKAQFEQDYRATGKRYHVGASCVRFRKIDDIPFDVIANAIGSVSTQELIAMHDQAQSLRQSLKK